MSFRLTWTEAFVDAPAAESFRFMSWAAEVRNKGCRSAITKSGNVHINISSSCSQWAWNMVIPLQHTKSHVPLLRQLLQQTEVTNLKENLRTQRQEREKTGWTEIIYKHWAHKSHMNKNELINLCFSSVWSHSDHLFATLSTFMKCWFDDWLSCSSASTFKIQDVYFHRHRKT